MAVVFSKSDEEFVEELIAWDDTRRSSDGVLCNISLGIAGMFILGAAIVTLLNMNDRIILGVLVPGFVVGLFFVGLHVLGSRRVRDRHQLALIIKKMKGAM